MSGDLEWMRQNQGPAMESGWLCPKCQKVHAPWVPSCTCHMVTLPVAPPAPARNDGPCDSKDSLAL